MPVLVFVVVCALLMLWYMRLATLAKNTVGAALAGRLGDRDIQRLARRR